MGKDTGIQWCHHTFNIAWGCLKVSPGCQFCYAADLAARFGYPDLWGPAATTARRTFGEQHWAEPLRWNASAERAGERRRVFCSSMADTFEDHPQLDTERRKLWSLVERTPWLDWLLLTKRPENINAMMPGGWQWSASGAAARVWLGVSTEDQATAEERIPWLLQAPAVVRFISAEPLLGPLDLSRWLVPVRYVEIDGDVVADVDESEFDWVVTGGESGPHARPLDLAWVRSLADQCRASGIAFFCKQLGTRWARSAGARDSHGGDPAEWPADLRVRQFPGELVSA